MDSFEEAFDNATRVADQALKANKDLSKQLHGLRKASLAGNITAVKREQGRLSEALDELTQAVNDAGVAWPFDDEQEVQYLKAADGYGAELRRVASEKGLLIRERDGHLICHPFIVRIIPGERAVRIDKKKVSDHQAVPLDRGSGQGAKVSPALSVPKLSLRRCTMCINLLTRKNPRCVSLAEPAPPLFSWTISTGFSRRCPAALGTIRKPTSRETSTNWIGAE